MRYKLPELLISHPHIIQAAVSVGKIHEFRMFIDLPDDFNFQGEPPKPVLRGAGDVFAKFIGQPVARAVDRVLGTDIQNCGGCKERREDWNQALPMPGQPPK